MAEPTREELGQWFTPTPVADLALHLACTGQVPKRVLDPSCGDGVFLERAHVLGIAESVGVDIDPKALGAAQRRVRKAQLHHADFFTWSAEESFEIIVGNPPYVRQERLDAARKSALVDSLALHLPALAPDQLSRLVGRSDLAAPFVLKALGMLAANGRAALVLSSAFFDSGYGEQFWALAAQLARLELVVDAPKERWFADAAVNAVIAVFQAGAANTPPAFARLHVSTKEAAQGLAEGAELRTLALVREAPSKAPQTWAAALRAPQAWFDFSASTALVPLGELADVRRGITSGANEIFYLSREEARRHELPANFLRPLLQAPGKTGHAGIEVSARGTQRVALVIPKETQLDDFPSLQRYFEQFPNAASRPSLASRNPWWALPARSAQVFLSKAYSERFVQPYCADKVIADQRVYCLHPKPGIRPVLLAAVLNSTMTALALESLGRASMGQGALEWSVSDAARLPVIDPRQIAEPEAILEAFAPLRERAIGNVKQESLEADRVALDRQLLGAAAALQPALSGALVQTCCDRIARSRLAA